MKVRLLLLALVAALVGSLIGPLAASAAPRAAETQTVANPATTPTSPSSLNPFANIQATGRATALSATGASAASAGTFAGRVTVQGFAVRNGHLVARVTVNGTVSTAAGTRSVGTVAATAPATVTGTCSVLNLVLGPLHLNLLGLVVDLNQVTLNITAQQGPGLLLGNLVCAIANLLNGGGPPNVLAGLLNSLISLIEKVLGSLTPSFTAPNNKLLFTESISTTVMASTPATVTAPVSGTCSILTLDLGPLHLNLLGLVIDLSPVHLTINAQAGPGNLLGNLLCAITNLLNGTPPNFSAIAKELNLLLTILRL